MADSDCPLAVRRVAAVSSFLGIAIFGVGALTQAVGMNLGALVFVAITMIWSARAMSRCENWGRSGYLISSPLAILLSVRALDDVEFLGSVLVFAIIASALLYVVALPTLLRTSTRQAFQRSQSWGIGTRSGQGFSVLLVGLVGFAFGWWWTNLSTSFHLLRGGDTQGVILCVAALAITAVLGQVILRTWWAASRNHVAGVILLTTGLALFEHALCYAAITRLAQGGGYGEAFGETSLIIVGRFVFAIVALLLGAALVRRQTATAPVVGA